MTAHTNKRAGRSTSSKVAVIGAGYVGLPTAATLAHFGHRVVLAERDESRLAALRSGGCPSSRPVWTSSWRRASGEDLALHRRLRRGRGRRRVRLLCVPTPQGDDGAADLSYVEAAAKEIGALLEPGTIVVNKSTVPVGSATFVERIIGRPDIRVVSNPEFCARAAPCATACTRPPRGRGR